MSKEYWNNLYASNDTGWDIGYPSPPIKEYVDQLKDKTLSILIPGCGNAYEAEYLNKIGFTNVTLIDIAPLVTQKLREKFGSDNSRKINIITGDFFEHEGKYQLIIEQTFLSALDPTLRHRYVEKMHALLLKGGHLTGVIFNKIFDEPGPPFGGTIEEYRQLFSSKFQVKQLEVCYNSIERRKGTEAFINLIAK